jgi:hypothetical protein
MAGACDGMVQWPYLPSVCKVGRVICEHVELSGHVGPAGVHIHQKHTVTLAACICYLGYQQESHRHQEEHKQLMNTSTKAASQLRTA